MTRRKLHSELLTTYVAGPAHSSGMEDLLRTLIAAARRVHATITPTVEDGLDWQLIKLDSGDLQTLRRLADHGPQTSATSRLRQFVTLRGGMQSLALSRDAALRLIRALEDFDRAVDRDRQVRNGTFTGPMSGSEAVQWTMGRARRGLQ